ncbi:alpha carbonic anhydrase 7-like [Vigna unguiculata]|uniref:Carbonic anhydrase n=1 Tax=Vigna unguiculata TaxID=3917 RepID=A0A4D6N7V1_VIGUN|nr:alpha carbonic anhydrase 7-like [Vigna unguiculata]QCE09358.1 carbonic anhydrase [Vigna unguiculata]
MDRAMSIKAFAHSLFILIVLLFHPAMSEDFDYDPSSPNGPPNWGNTWPLCRDGTRQSPINLNTVTSNVVFSSGIQRNYQPANATLVTSEHDVMINWTENAGNIIINGTQYQLLQAHWHSPSEHIINGIRFDLELHMVHRSSDAKLAVIGIPFKKGDPDNFVSTIKDDLQLLAENQTRTVALGSVDPEDVAGITGNKYFRYNGSLTVPPCSENVLWTVFTGEGKTVSRAQNKLIRAAVDGAGDETFENARPVQPRNGRPVKRYYLSTN